MKNDEKRSYSTRGSKIAIALSVISFVIYLANVAAGKANVVYGLNLFQVGNVIEFLILLFTSTTFIVAALLQEAKWKSIKESTTE